MSSVKKTESVAKPFQKKKTNFKRSNLKGSQKKQKFNNKSRNNNKKPIKHVNLSFVAPQGLEAGLNPRQIVGDNKFGKWAEFVETLKARGPDLRLTGSSLTTSGLLSDTAIEANKIIVPVDSETLLGVFVSVISHAYTHGWRQQVMQEDKNWYPYFACIFMSNALRSVVSGIQDKVPKVSFPDFFLEIMAALQPKDGVQVGSGTMGYSWGLRQQNFIPSDKFFYPANVTQVGEYTFYVATSSFESGYNKMGPPTSVTYSDDMGAQAFQALITFMGRKLVGASNKYHPYMKKDYKLEGTLMERSTSSFAMSSCVVGGGLYGGYVSSLASSETYIQHPKFSCFSFPGVSDRGYRNHKPSSGDSNWLVASLLLQQKAMEVTNPNYAIFKPVDFYEFVDRVAMFLCEAFTLMYHDNGINTTDLPNLGLNSVQFLILFRKILMRNFSSTQYGVQSLRFYPSSLGGSDDFIPFLCSSGTCSSQSVGTVILPMFAAENLNALRGRAVYPNINPKNKKMIDKYPRLYVPVLGIYTKSFFDSSRYKYTDGSGNQIDLFLPTSDTVSLVSGTVNSSFVDMDCSAIIQEHMDRFNKVMNTLSPFIQQPTDFTGDAGINMLTVIGDTMILEEKKSENLKKEKKEKKEKKGGPDVVIINKLVTARISQQIPIVDIVPIKRIFVNPEYLVFRSNVGVGSVSTSLLRSLNLEMWLEYDGQRYSASTEGNYSDINVLRKQWVANCVKGRTADNNTIVKQMLKLTKAGEAGLLGELVGVFGGELASGAIRTASSFLPI